MPADEDTGDGRPSSAQPEHLPAIDEEHQQHEQQKPPSDHVASQQQVQQAEQAEQRPHRPSRLPSAPPTPFGPPTPLPQASPATSMQQHVLRQNSTQAPRDLFSRLPTDTQSTYEAHAAPDEATWHLPHQQGQQGTMPSYSLAGPNDSDAVPHPEVYIHPMYRQLNPRYGKGREGPVWGLARPLPRVVRPGMRQDKKSETVAYPTASKGETEPAPELEATPGRPVSQSGRSEREAAWKSQRSASREHRLKQQNSAAAGYTLSDAGEIPFEQAMYPSHPQPDRNIRPIESEVREKPSKPSDAGQAAPKEGDQKEFFNKWAWVRHAFREPFAEWLGCTVSILIGLCGSLNFATAGTKAENRISVNWSWGLGFMVGIYIAGGISGAHLNPAISIALWIYRGFPGRRCCYYIIAQVLGGLTAGGIAYLLYRDSIAHLNPNPTLNPSGVGFYTGPLAYISRPTAFFTEFVATAVLVCTIFAMGDDSNAPPGAGMHSFVIGLVIFVASIVFGYNTGGCFNPARDFGPRLVALMAGYGGQTFLENDCWWLWGAWVATISGAIAGASVYDTFIFIGGESPINYAPRRRKRAKLKKEAKWRRRLRWNRKKVPQIENEIKDLEQ